MKVIGCSVVPITTGHGGAIPASPSARIAYVQQGSNLRWVATALVKSDAGVLSS